MLIVVAIMMGAFMVTAALAIDIAKMQLTRTELRTATDAAAKAAAVALSQELETDKAIERGIQVGAANKVDGVPLGLQLSNFQFGRSVEDSKSGRFVFSANQEPLNSVRVAGERSGSGPNGAVPLFLGQILGKSAFETSLNATATFLERDVVLVVDRSGSMRGQKFLELKDAINIFVATLDETPVEEEVGLVSYSFRSGPRPAASIDVRMTKNIKKIPKAMGRLVASGGTDIGSGILTGLNTLNSGRGKKFVEQTMIVMTDGIPSGGGVNSEAAARTAANQEVIVHAITFGAGADQRRMQRVANIGRGRHFHAANGSQLRAIYREIALSLSTLLTE